jgi:hypothetical protein
MVFTLRLSAYLCDLCDLCDLCVKKLFSAEIAEIRREPQRR